jgi:hypothetical protein
MQNFETRGADAPPWLVLFKDWPKDSEIGSFFRGAGDLGPGVARDPNRRASTRATMVPDRSHLGGRNVIRAQVHPIGSARESNVGAGVYQNTSIQFAVLGSQLDDFSRQEFEVVGGEVFFAQLDVIHAAAGGMAHGCE